MCIRDYSNIKSFAFNLQLNITDSEIIDLLSKIKLLKEKQQWFFENDITLKENLGGFYTGEQTNFNDVKKSFNLFENIYLYFNGNIPENIKNLLI